MKLFKLIFLIALSATILIGCDRQLLSPIDPTDPSQTTVQFAQKALSDLADTAAKRGFVDLANAANEVVGVLEIETGTIAEPTPEFLKLALEASALERGFGQTACRIELRKFAIASVHTAKTHVTEITGYEFYGRLGLRALSEIYPPKGPSDMEQALQNLAQEALNAEAALQQLPTETYFIPFVFGYGLGIDVYANYNHYYVGCPPYEPGIIYIRYDVKIRPAIETQAAVNEFLINNGYTVTEEGVIVHRDRVDLGSDVDLISIVKELRTIPGVAGARPHFYNCTGVAYPDDTSCPYFPGVIYIRYDVKIRPAIETQAAVNEFLINKGYTVPTERDISAVKPVNLGSDVDLIPIAIELDTIPGVALADINFYACVDEVPIPPPKSVEIIDRVRTRYNEAWCQGNFDLINSILIEESRLDFFDYAFVRNLADIYAEEVPEDANLIQANGFSLRPIGITFLTIYFQHWGKTRDEIIEIFRQTVRNRNMGIETVTIKHFYYPVIQ